MYAGYIIVSIGVESCSPLFYELACESTYPIAEGVTNSLLTWLNNVVGLTFLLVLMSPNIGQYPVCITYAYVNTLTPAVAIWVQL